MNLNMSTQQVAASYPPMSAFTGQGMEPDQGSGHSQERSHSQEQGISASASALRPLSELLKLMGSSETSPQTDSASLVPVAALQVAVQQVAGQQVAVRQVRAGTALFLEGTRATHLYVVRLGTFKTIKTAEDGYEQVLAFTGMGEVMGFEALCENRQPVE